MKYAQKDMRMCVQEIFIKLWTRCRKFYLFTPLLNKLLRLEPNSLIFRVIPAKCTDS